MISYRQADILKRIQEADQNPIGKIFRCVPSQLSHHHNEPILRVFPGGVETKYTATAVGPFLGCRDGYAFFQNYTLTELTGKNLIIDNKTHGIIVSTNKGIFKTDRGLSFPSESLDYLPSDSYVNELRFK